MTYEQAIAGGSPKTVEEAMEKAFWRAAGRELLGAGLQETWQAVATSARVFIKYSDWAATEPDVLFTLNQACLGVAVILEAASEGTPLSSGFLHLLEQRHAEWLKVLAKARGENI